MSEPNTNVRISREDGALPHARVHYRGKALDIVLSVPTYEGECEFTLTAEPDSDGDWRVFLPDVEQYDVSGGIVYLGGPEA